MQLGFDLGDIESKQEDVEQVMKELCVNCTSCRVSQRHLYNRGMIYRGSLFGRIAIIGIAPGSSETERGVAMIGESGKLMEKWMKYLGVNINRDTFICNILQCQPQEKFIEIVKGEEKEVWKQRDPAKDEINACFGPRCLRVLRAMPNLEVIITLGWLPAAAFLGTDKDRNIPKTKTHEGQWFESSLMPSIPIFCLSHPAELIRKDKYGKEEASDDRKVAIKHCLDNFKREYLQNNKVTTLAKRAQQDREEAGLGMF